MSVHFTLGEAARKVTVTKSTLHRAIKDGRLSANRDDQGHYQINAAELFRVFDPIPRDDDPNDQVHHTEHSAERSGTSHVTADSETIRWFQKEISELKEENDELQTENGELTSTVAELKAAMTALPSPERHQAEIERIEQESQERLNRQKQAHADELDRQRGIQAKAVAEQKQHAEQWKADLAARQREVQAAREEAGKLKQQAADDLAKIERRAVSERTQREALEKRGLIARILNRKPVVTG